MVDVCWLEPVPKTFDPNALLKGLENDAHYGSLALAAT